MKISELETGTYFLLNSNFRVSSEIFVKTIAEMTVNSVVCNAVSLDGGNFILKDTDCDITVIPFSPLQPTIEVNGQYYFVFSAADADKLPKNSVGFVADSIDVLKRKIERNEVKKVKVGVKSEYFKYVDKESSISYSLFAMPAEQHITPNQSLQNRIKALESEIQAIKSEIEGDNNER